MEGMLVKVGHKKDFIEKYTSLQTSGWMSDTLLKKPSNTYWWKGMDIEYGKRVSH